MTTSGKDPSTSKDTSEKDTGLTEPPAKLIRVDELEASIGKILERTLRRATEGQGPQGTIQPIQNKTAGEKRPPPNKGFSQ